MTIRPSQDQVARMASDGSQGPIVMVNLLKYRARADYPADKPEAGEMLSGREAYLRYGVEVSKILGKIGARIVWQGRQSLVMIGEGEGWDDVVCVRYPSRQAFLGMARSAEYNAIHYHRDAGLADTVLLCCEAGTAA
ncbi:MAG TPA: DUF1330 domain-containing protein [Rhizomicrobium sp.]